MLAAVSHRDQGCGQQHRLEETRQQRGGFSAPSMACELALELELLFNVISEPPGSQRSQG